VAHVFFLLAFGKNEQANVTPEQRDLCRAYAASIKKRLERGV
jgi:hypothetical protein